MRIVLMLGGLMIQMALPVLAASAPTLSWRLIQSYPHDATSFTQGLVVDGDQLVEGTGLYGHSRLTVRNLQTGALLHSAELPANQFGEGVAIAGDRIIQLTWMNGIAHVYDRALRPLSRFRLSSEGWGLTYDGKRLIRSDGTSTLRFHDLGDYSETGKVDVTDDGLRIEHLNELEFIDGYVYANVWQTDRIAVIDSKSGKVCAWLDLTDLSKQMAPSVSLNSRDAVLNGIALLPRSGHLLVTGKLWPRSFELSVDRKPLRCR